MAFIFTMDLLNYCFWSDHDDDDGKGKRSGFRVEYAGKRWSGYWSLVAALRRALDEGTSFDKRLPDLLHVLFNSSAISTCLPDLLRFLILTLKKKHKN